jgi:hypothetical protein
MLSQGPVPQTGDRSCVADPNCRARLLVQYVCLEIKKGCRGGAFRCALGRRYHDGSNMERLHASVSVMVARTHKRPESALSKISFKFGRGAPSGALQSFSDATRAGCSGRAPSDASRRASPASRGRRSVRKAAAKGRNPTIRGPEALKQAPAALRRTPARGARRWGAVLGGCTCSTRESRCNLRAYAAGRSVALRSTFDSFNFDSLFEHWHY